MTAAGTLAQPTLTIYYDNDSSKFEQFQPPVPLTASSGPTPIRAVTKPRTQRCTTFKYRMTLPTGDAILRLDGWTAQVHVWPGAQLLQRSDTWTTTAVGTPGTTPCPDCPTFPPHTSLPTATREFFLTKITGNLLGTVGDNQASIMVQTINALIAQGTWTVVKSCDGISVATGSNLWVNQASIGTHSWIQIQNVLTGVQYVISCSVRGAGAGGWTEFLRYVSVHGSFTGGTTLARPTAADEFESNNPVGSDWLGTGPTPANPQFYSYVWSSTDGALTRIAWMFNGKLCAWWQWDQVQFPSSGAWVPWVSIEWDGGNNYSAPGSRLSPLNYQLGPSSHVLTQLGVVKAVAPFMTGYGGNLFIESWTTNEATGQYWWERPPLIANTVNPPGDRGAAGFMADIWLVGTTGGAGGTPVFAFGDTANGGQFIFIDSLMLPWDGTTNPLGIVGSTDHPASSFFGQTTS
jgi:hypothetical protein